MRSSGGASATSFLKPEDGPFPRRGRALFPKACSAASASSVPEARHAGSNIARGRILCQDCTYLSCGTHLRNFKNEDASHLRGSGRGSRAAAARSRRGGRTPMATEYALVAEE